MKKKSMHTSQVEHPQVSDFEKTVAKKRNKEIGISNRKST